MDNSDFRIFAPLASRALPTVTTKATTKATAMEAFATQPQSEAELQSALAEMPRSELQALGKTHGVRATLKSESLVGKLKRVLAEQLWPAREDEKDEEEDGKAADAAEEVEETEKKADATVGKKAAVQRKKPSSPPQRVGKWRKSTPVKVTVRTPTKALDKIHAKQMARQPTLQEHEQAKKQRAAVLLAGSKFSAVKMTRSKTKERFGEEKDKETVSMTLSFTTPTKAAASSAKKTQSADDSADAKAPVAKWANTTRYKPHAGPLPPYTGDSLFSPKKIEPRPAPMSVAVMKASRVATPKKTEPKKTVAHTKTVESHEKKEVVSGTVATDKENASPSQPPENKENTKTEAVTVAVNKPEAPAKRRSSVKAAASKAVSQDTKNQERRSKFTQVAKAKGAAIRSRGRSTSKSN